MNRYFSLTDKAKQALWTKTSGVPHIPVKFVVMGDTKQGYRVLTLDKDDCGFVAYVCDKLSAAKLFIEEVNGTGDFYDKSSCPVGTFAWKNHPIPNE